MDFFVDYVMIWTRICKMAMQDGVVQGALGLRCKIPLA